MRPRDSARNCERLTGPTKTLDRRQFLQTAGAGVLLAACLPALRAAIPTANLSLGFSLYGMKTLPLGRALAECSRIGYGNVELPLLPGFTTELKTLTPADRKALRTQLSDLGLTVSSLMVNMSLVADPRAHAANVALIESAAEFAHELNSAAPPVLETVMGGKPDAWETARADMARELREWGSAAARGRVELAVKAHVSSAVNSPARLLWIVEQAGSPSIVVAYDHSHFELGGISVRDSLHALGGRARFVHVKDAVREGTTVRFLLPGEGSTDYVAYFKLLRASGYRGAVVVEVSSQIFSRPGFDPIAAAEQSFRALAPAQAQV